jgi:hypothetical protein
MKFRMVCPKCQTANFSIERDNRSYAPRGQMFEMIFSCRCGKQLFGDQIEAEYVRQQTVFESTKHTQKVERVAPTPPPPVAPAPRPAVSVATSSPGPEEVWPDQTPQEERAQTDASSCEWHICHNPPRPNSKYCSRDCSNKNARLRYKKRKNADKAAA